jgi:hypothetical protein
MLKTRLFRVGALGAVGVAALGATATAAGPPTPVSTSGKKVQSLGVVPTPTSWAFAGKTTFVGAFGTESEDGKTPPTPGGIYTLKGGKATLVPGSAAFVMGVVAHGGKLYSSEGKSIVVRSGWNGKKFAHRKTLWTGPKKFSGLNGLAWGPDNRIYAGVTLADGNDHGPAKTPYAYSVLSLKPNGKNLKVVAKGMRQPYQMTFTKGSKAPLVSVLGQDQPDGIKVPDWIVRAKPGRDFGFPKCTWAKPAKCKGHPKPFKLLPAHFSPMGIAPAGGKLYVSGFGGNKSGPGIYSMTLKGKKLKQVVNTFAPNISLGAHNGWLYFGGVTGAVYRVKQ